MVAAMLAELVPRFQVGKTTFLQLHYPGRKASSYHIYEGGRTWVPTIPRSLACPGERLGIDAHLLTLENFLHDFPTIGLSTNIKAAWVTRRVEVRVTKQSEQVCLLVRQDPSIEGVSAYAIKGRLSQDLRFQKGSVFATLEVLDVFSQPTFVQLHHNGHRRAWLSRRRKASAKIRLLSFDGVRLRVFYRLAKGNSSTVVYLRPPSCLFDLGNPQDFPRNIEPLGLEKKFRMENIRPIRPLETAIIENGRYYETGRIGAEITYSIVSEKLGAKDLIINEPALGGTDLYTSNRKTLAESRFILGTPNSRLSEQIMLELARMTRKLRTDFRWNPGAEVGYVVLSYLKDGRIDSLVAEMPNSR